MTEEKKKKIANALATRIEKLFCPICHHQKYTLLDGYFIDSIQEDYREMRLDSKRLPSIILVCNNCGHLDSFSLGVLSLIEEDKQINNNDK